MRWALGLVLATTTAPSVVGELSFSADFESGSLSPFVRSSNPRYEGQEVEVVDGGVKLVQANKHYGLGAPVEFKPDGSLVVQYDVTLTTGLSCGGAYLKLLEATPSLSVETFDDKTPFVLMFGPDKCGTTDKVHFIVRQKNPVSGEWVEHHLKGGPKAKVDKRAHMYTAIVKPDDSIEILIDGESVFVGSLTSSLDPPLQPPADVDDPEDSKPADWVDAAKIDDPDAVKPDDWDEDAPRKIPDADASKPSGWLDDEPLEIPDPEARRPPDWDDEEDGEWEAPTVPNPKCDVGCGEWERPLVDNPAYKGKWKPPKIDNPAYKGKWAPRKIPNPHFFEPKEPAKNLPPIGAVAVEIWTTNSGILYDNIALGHDPKDASDFAKSFYDKKAAEEEAKKKKKQERDAKKLEKKLEKGALSAKVQVAVNDALKLANEQPLAALATAIAALLALAALCLGGSKKKTTTPGASEPAATSEPPAPAAAPAAAAAEKEEEEEDTSTPAAAAADDDNKPPRDED
ncbi:hypothetical protein CTAYLR_003691 [Chrysophaeum taylorii]|uniref:Calreticulin n=1 Tax=Chrysophaeum taylorii TaxID=2483200 RepID=A0AAD7UMB2_9STRA|nr:hypothetical protein CTAYLR_003691 [Chrysophaeum taylorii]